MSWILQKALRAFYKWGFLLKVLIVPYVQSPHSINMKFKQKTFEICTVPQNHGVTESPGLFLALCEALCEAGLESSANQLFFLFVVGFLGGVGQILGSAYSQTMKSQHCLLWGLNYSIAIKQLQTFVIGLLCNLALSLYFWVEKLRQEEQAWCSGQASLLLAGIKKYADIRNINHKLAKEDFLLVTKFVFLRASWKWSI